jgi:hypothetical protein
MEPIRIRTKVESETLNLPQLKPLIGKVVEIFVVEIAVASREEVFAEAVYLPETAEERAAQQAKFRNWRADPRYEFYWPMIERLIEVDQALTPNGAGASTGAVAS